MLPTVTFVVPCYNLAHLLGDCVRSILGQTFQNFEILVMDDCSPDHTAEVASSFADPRVRYHRNQPNIGHLRNYNEGIALARGQYVWLISADDMLRRPYVLERYVALLDAHPEVGYVFCPAVTLWNGREMGTLQYSNLGPSDTIMNGRAWLSELIFENKIVAATAMARKECYDTVSNFPLDLPWNADWFLWCRFALHFDVAYFAEAMVCYRQHDLNITHTLLRDHLDHCAAADLAMPWLIRGLALKHGHPALARQCLMASAAEYVRRLTATRYRTSDSRMTLQQFEKSLDQVPGESAAKNSVRAQVYSQLSTVRNDPNSPVTLRPSL
jgi:glycosyltransferase involved in cell wall biosynthesis